MNKWRNTTMIQSTSISPRRQQRREWVREGRKEETQQGVCVLVLSCGEAPEEQNEAAATAVEQWRRSKGNQSSASQEKTELQQLQELPAWCSVLLGKESPSISNHSHQFSAFFLTPSQSPKGWFKPCTAPRYVFLLTGHGERVGTGWVSLVSWQAKVAAWRGFCWAWPDGAGASRDSSCPTLLLPFMPTPTPLCVATRAAKPRISLVVNEEGKQTKNQVVVSF